VGLDLEPTEIAESEIDQAIEILRKDSPFKFSFYPVDYILYHEWYKNTMAGGVIQNGAKYLDISVETRAQYRERENKPQLFWPVSILVFLVGAFFLTAYRFLKKEMN
jgi:hypothetical protein